MHGITTAKCVRKQKRYLGCIAPRAFSLDTSPSPATHQILKDSRLWCALRKYLSVHVVKLSFHYFFPSNFADFPRAPSQVQKFKKWWRTSYIHVYKIGLSCSRRLLEVGLFPKIKGTAATPGSNLIIPPLSDWNLLMERDLSFQRWRFSSVPQELILNKPDDFDFEECYLICKQHTAQQ